MSEIIKGFKVFNPDWTCSPNGNTKQYTCPGKFEEDVTPVRCGQGMHFCKVAADCFNYYDFNPDNHVAEVAAYGEVVEEGDKCATNKLEIIREIPWAELLEMVNTGKGCAGLCNSGNRNSGNRNSGNRNSGNRNSGNRNSGDWNSGDCNSGDWNSGNRNSGDWNSGDWNNTNFSNGCFNTVEPKIHLFNKPSEWTYRDWLNSEARYLMNQIQGDILEWVYLSDMTDEEKAAHPEAETTGGYLKELDNSECAVIWWRSLDQRKKNVIMAIPNFDKAIFKEITGIDVDAD
ncbi:MAG: hypothetical protein [Bacteriophage sp.]|nr:MAG: hypothetical protein [Bacteriophage sp.]